VWFPFLYPYVAVRTSMLTSIYRAVSSSHFYDPRPIYPCPLLLTSATLEVSLHSHRHRRPHVHCHQVQHQSHSLVNNALNRTCSIPHSTSDILLHTCCTLHTTTLLPHSHPNTLRPSHGDQLISLIHPLYSLFSHLA
jgi:hypothetical protein